MEPVAILNGLIEIPEVTVRKRAIDLDVCRIEGQQLEKRIKLVGPAQEPRGLLAGSFLTIRQQRPRELPGREVTPLVPVEQRARLGSDVELEQPVQQVEASADSILRVEVELLAADRDGLSVLAERPQGT